MKEERADVQSACVRACRPTYLSLYLSMYWVLMLVSPFPPGAQLQVRSLVFLDQQVRLTGLSGGTGVKREEGEMGEEGGEERREQETETGGRERKWEEREQSYFQPLL